MASQKIKFTVGLFVACGIGIALVAIIWLGMSSIFETGRVFYATYFDESVQGLVKDSPVKYRGVAIGRVEKIGVAPDSRLIEVVLKIESGQKLETDYVAQIASVGITGSKFVELDRKRGGEKDLSPALDFRSSYKVVASKPSEMSQLMRGIDDVLKQIRTLDLPRISEKITSTLDKVESGINDAEIRNISLRAQKSLDSLNRILESPRLDNILASVEHATGGLPTLMKKAENIMDISEDTLVRVHGLVEDKDEAVRKAFEDFKNAMKNANRFLERGTAMMDTTDNSLSHLKRHLLVVAQNLEKASENLNLLLEVVSAQPSQLFFGEPPAAREVEPEVIRKSVKEIKQ